VAYKNALPVIASAATRSLTRREIVQGILGGLGAALAWPGITAAHPIHGHLATLAAAPDSKIAAADWALEALDSHQNDTLVALAERMVPGSTEAQVNRTIDLLLGVDSQENRQKFTDSLSVMDGESQKRFGQAFKFLSVVHQDELLTQVSAGKSSEDEDSPGAGTNKRSGKRPPTPRDHFENLKGWIVGTYYSSEVGMRELGWTDEQYFDDLPSCPHPEGHH